MSLIELQSADTSVVRLTLRVVRMRSFSRLILSGPQVRSLNQVSISPPSTGVHSG